MYKEIWYCVHDLIDFKYQNINEKKYEKEIEDIRGDIQSLADKIEADIDNEIAYIKSKQTD